MTVILKNPLRTKQLQQGLAQLGEEGAIQVFRPEVGGPMLLGAVGQLQFEVVQHRLKTEYDADVRLEGCQYTGARWITADTPAELRAFIDAYPQRMARDAADTLAYLCTSPYDVRLAQERFPKIHFHPLREHAGLACRPPADATPCCSRRLAAAGAPRTGRRVHRHRRHADHRGRHHARRAGRRWRTCAPPASTASRSPAARWAGASRSRCSGRSMRSWPRTARWRSCPPPSGGIEEALPAG